MSRCDTTPLPRAIVSTYQLISCIFGEVPGRRREVNEKGERPVVQYSQGSGDESNEVPMCGEDDGLPVVIQFFLCIPMKGGDDLFLMNHEILFSSTSSGVPNGAPPASIKGHVGLSLTGVHILTTPVVAHSRLPTVLAVLFTLEEKCLPP
jgi:hypothetical protein